MIGYLLFLVDFRVGYDLKMPSFLCFALEVFAIAFDDVFEQDQNPGFHSPQKILILVLLSDVPPAYVDLNVEVVPSEICFLAQCFEVCFPIAEDFTRPTNLSVQHLKGDFIDSFSGVVV